MDNSEYYVDVEAEGIPPLDHPLRTSLPNSTDFDHLQNNSIEIHYHPVDTDGMDEREYTDLRKPPPISPKPRGVKSQLINCQRPFAVKRIGDIETSKECRKPLPLPSENRALDKSLPHDQSQRIGQPSKQHYQELSSRTMDYLELYTYPSASSKT